jgi:hypothetical protein
MYVYYNPFLLYPTTTKTTFFVLCFFKEAQNIVYNKYHFKQIIIATKMQYRIYLLLNID